MQGKRLTLTEHLEELRSRIIKSVIFILISSCLLYSFIDKLLPILVKPVGKLIFIDPLIILFLTKIGIVTPEFLSKKRRHAIVSIFILAAALTPPDVITQCLMAAPLLVLYEIGIIFSKMAYRPRPV